MTYLNRKISLLFLLIILSRFQLVSSQEIDEDELLPSERKITKIITSVYDGLGFEYHTNSTRCKEAILEAFDVGHLLHVNISENFNGSASQYFKKLDPYLTISSMVSNEFAQSVLHCPITWTSQVTRYIKHFD